MDLLEHPENVSNDGYTAFASAIWSFMTPRPLQPSMHEIVVGAWTPNAADEAAGITGTFGTTINIINGEEECGE